MSMPTVPDIKPEIDLCTKDVVNLLYVSIALEELGLAHIINAEAEKIQYVLGTLNGGLRTEPVTFKELMEVNESVDRTLKTVIKKEMLLQFKLEDVMAIPVEKDPTV